MTKVIRGAGWTLVGVGTLILLYLVYLMFFTNLKTDAAQSELLEQWELEVGEVGGEGGEVGEAALPGEELDGQATRERDPVDPGDAYAVMWFERPGSDEPLVHADPLLVVEGVAVEDLRKGPGHYADTVGPGEQGNLAIAGHRTTYGAPFYHLDDLEPGDEIHVVDRDRQEWVYVVTRSNVIVQPSEVWVIGDDPLGTGAPTLTLTTCHPLLSAAQRLIVFAELRTEA